jgi:hypothetical protein
MRYTVFLIALSILLGCGNTKKEGSQYYSAKNDWHGISNKILQKDLKAIINESPYTFLNEYLPNSFQDSSAYKLLLENLKIRNLKISHFYITNYSQPNDSTVVYELNHIDYLVYRYNFEKAGNAIPITGNISGFEGMYIVDVKSSNIEIRLYQ